MMKQLKNVLLRFKIRLIGEIAAPLIAKLSFWRWPNTDLRQLIRRALADESINLPPLFRAVLAAPTGPYWMRHAVSYDWHRARGTLHPGGPPDLGGNLFTAWTGPGLAFLHIEKCGGIAVMHWLSRQFHPEQINPDDHRDLPPHLAYRTPRFAGIDPARFPLIWGHYDAPTLQRLAPAHKMFTLLREPRARVLSLYYFWASVEPTQIDPELSFSVSLAHQLTLEEFLNHEDPMLLDLIDNIYVRRLTGLYATGATPDPVHAAPAAALDAAFEMVDGMAFAGITERMDDSMLAFAMQFGIAPPSASLRGNVTEENHTDPSGWFREVRRAEHTPEVEAALARRTTLDRRLYEHVTERFERQSSIQC